MTTTETRKHGPLWMVIGILLWAGLVALIVESAVAHSWTPFTAGIIGGGMILGLLARANGFARRPVEFLLNTTPGRIIAAAIMVAAMSLTMRDLHRLEWYLAVTVPLMAIWIAASWRFRWRAK